jgi:cellulose synthase/poly-beta-1,6-N-acetylglucosamine synthase-like glycosyltransferase
MTLSSHLYFLVPAFWACFAVVVYTYAGYPLILWVLSRLAGNRQEPADLRGVDLPTVSLLIAAYNEEAVIEERVRNAMALDYPSDRFEIVIASDGSSDSTADIVARFAPQGVRSFAYNENRGKATVLNCTVPELSGKLILFSDANTRMDAQAVRRLVRWFQDPQVGAVSGKLVLVDSETGRNADGMYWKYETFLKQCEGKLGALLGANGAIYAMRRELYEPIPPTTVDDFLIPLQARLRSNCRIVFDSSATAFEETAPDALAEFHRRARFGAGGFEAVGLLWRLLDPRRGWICFTFVSHKILRWACPLFALAMLLATVLMVQSTLYRGLLLGQLCFYGLSLGVIFVPTAAKVWKPLRLAGMFTLMNVALLIGFCRWLSRSQGGTWKPARTPVRN